MKKLFYRIFLVIAISVFLGCGSSRSHAEKEKEILLDKLTLLVESIQADEWDKTLAMLGESDKQALVGSGQQIPVTIKSKLKSLKLSTLAHHGQVQVQKGKLVGIVQALPLDTVTPKMDTIQEVPSFQ
jgi:uncharacterized protein YcfL